MDDNKHSFHVQGGRAETDITDTHDMACGHVKASSAQRMHGKKYPD
jgi:hypothetical protein